MPEGPPVDCYEVLQISSNAEPETIHRVYRMLAQRFHPDNQDTGNDTKFREVNDAYHVLSDPERRAQYDVGHQKLRQDRWRFVSKSAEAENDFESEQRTRLTMLEILYTRRRAEPREPGVYIVDIEKMIGQPREHLEFPVWYLVQKKFISKSDNALLVITAEGVEYLEQNYQVSAPAKRLRAKND
jgi:curved DNA-binding protein CbpA